jgi:uncharacterized RmlC-like cupin family protein
VRIIRPEQFDSNIAQTPGLHRLAAVTTENTGATKLWAGTFTVNAKAKTGAHHHGDLVYNLDIEGVETPELIRWIDDLHK